MDRLTRWGTSLVVVAVAAFAAVVSYSHIYDLGRAHGQAGTAARLLPLSVDGLILAASLMLLGAARRRLPRPVLAQWMLGLGVAATIAANVAYGAAYGPLGAFISAWPAIAFVGAAEMLIGLIRASGHQAAEGSPGHVPAVVPATAEDAARQAYAASVAGGNPLSMNRLATNFGLTRMQARAILAGANGHAPDSQPTQA